MPHTCILHAEPRNGFAVPPIVADLLSSGQIDAVVVRCQHLNSGISLWNASVSIRLTHEGVAHNVHLLDEAPQPVRNTLCMAAGALMLSPQICWPDWFARVAREHITDFLDTGDEDMALVLTPHGVACAFEISHDSPSRPFILFAKPMISAHDKMAEMDRISRLEHSINTLSRDFLF